VGARPSSNDRLQVVVANYEIVAEPNRLLAELILPDGRLVAYGSVQMRFAKLDDSGQPSVRRAKSFKAPISRSSWFTGFGVPTLTFIRRYD
jgi:hypothetical protein